MQSLSVLVAGDGETIGLLRASKLLGKLFTTSENKFEGAINIRFNTFKGLAEQCKALQIDFVIVENKKWISQGITEVLRKNFVNVFALNSSFYDLISSNSLSKKLCEKYRILTPKILAYPSQFPLYVRTLGTKRLANSLEEAIKIRQEINEYPQEVIDSTFLEEVIEGEEIEFISLFDSKTLLGFYPENLNEAQKIGLAEYNKKLEQMFISEAPSSIGFISSSLVWNGKSWYNQGFGINFPKPEIDFMFILVSAIYQKLDEISL